MTPIKDKEFSRGPCGVGRVSITLINGNCLEVLREMDRVECIFADPPDNIGLDYADGDDNLDPADYDNLLLNWFVLCLRKANSVWFSFNSRHIATMGHIVYKEFRPWEPLGYRFHPCVQTFGKRAK